MFSSHRLRARRRSGGSEENTETRVHHDVSVLRNVDSSAETDVMSKLLWKAKMVKAIQKLDTTEVERLLSDDVYKTFCNNQFNVTQKKRKTFLDSAFRKDTIWYRLLNETIPFYSTLYKEPFYTNWLLFTMYSAAEFITREYTQQKEEELRNEQRGVEGSLTEKKTRLNPNGGLVSPLEKRIQEKYVEKMNQIVEMLIKRGATDHNTFLPSGAGRFRNALHFAISLHFVKTIEILLSPFTKVNPEVRYPYFFRILGKYDKIKKPYNVLMEVGKSNNPHITRLFENLGFHFSEEDEEDSWNDPYDKKAVLISKFSPKARRQERMNRGPFEGHGSVYQKVKNYPFPTPEQFERRLDNMQKKWRIRIGQSEGSSANWKIEANDNIAEYAENLREIYKNKKIGRKRDKLDAFEHLLHADGPMKRNIEMALTVAGLDLPDLDEKEQAEYLYIWNIRETSEQEESQ